MDMMIYGDDAAGTLPQWGQPMRVSSLSLYNNTFTGPLPVSWMELANLTSVNVANNQISGELPVNWGLPNVFGEPIYEVKASMSSASIHGKRHSCRYSWASCVE